VVEIPKTAESSLGIGARQLFFDNTHQDSILPGKVDRLGKSSILVYNALSPQSRLPDYRGARTILLDSCTAVARRPPHKQRNLAKYCTSPGTLGAGTVQRPPKTSENPLKGRMADCGWTAAMPWDDLRH
jgi:hypothetical protein